MIIFIELTCVFWNIDALDKCRSCHYITEVRIVTWLEKVSEAKAWVRILINSHVRLKTIKSRQTWSLKFGFHIPEQI